MGEARRVDDSLIRAELYAELAVGYRAVGDPAGTASLARAAIEVAREMAPSEPGVRVLLRSAVLLAEFDDREAALRVFDSALGFASGAEPPRSTGTVLVDLVEAALAVGEIGRPVLREALDLVYVIPDNAIRADTIISIAGLYQAGGVGLSVTGLIQQAMPAVRSLPNRYLRADFYGRLARLSSGAREDALTERLVRYSLDEVTRAGGPASAEDQRFVVDLISSLVTVGASDAADRALASLPGAYFRVLGLLARANGADADAPALRSQAAELVKTLTDDQQRIDAVTRLGESYLAADDRERARSLADEAGALLLLDPSNFTRVGLVSALARLHVKLDQFEPVQRQLLGVEDGYIRGLVAVAAADTLIGSGQYGLADEFLIAGLVASDETTYLADDVRERVVHGFARTGSVRLAIRTVERMRDPVARARAVTRLAVTAEPAGQVTPILRADLASVLAARR